MRMRLIGAAICVGIVLMLGGCGKADKFYTNGQEAFSKGEYENALSYFSQALEKNPNKAEYYIEQGYAYIALGQYEEAREAFLSAIVERDLEITRKNNKRNYR